MRRREFITLFGGAAATRPLAARAQQPAGRIFRVGYLSIGSREQIAHHFVKAFEEGLRELGYRIGENVVIEYGFANGETERLPAVAADLVRLGVDVILTGFNPTTIAAGETRTDCHGQQYRSSEYRACREPGAPRRERHRVDQ